MILKNIISVNEMFSFLTKIGPKSGLGEHYGQNLSDKKGLIRTIGKKL